ncbi:sigma-54-dependent transcriptional regulator [Candidatus Latescibacterota bacterium]
MSRILVVDDESLMREFITESLVSQGYDVDDAENGSRALEFLANETYDVILTDYKMPRVTGMDVLKRAREKMPDAKVIIMTAYGTVENAVEAMKLGAFDYITKPFSVDEVLILVKRAVEFTSLQVENRRLHSELEEVCGIRSIVGNTPPMKRIFDVIETVSQSRSTVLISGDSGTGKELVARAIHFSSPRSGGPFVKLNCAALPSDLMESEMFGHEKGAFTGAVKKFRGRFERADNGTLLLDEISEMSPHLQAKLLRVIQEREFEPVGSTETLRVDVRIIATTNRNLVEQIEKGVFREDLFYRLNVINIHMPSLRERKSDIPVLAEHFLSIYNKENGKAIEGMSDEVLENWATYDWPGNVRELENAVERAVVMCKGKILEGPDIAAVPGFGAGAAATTGTGTQGISVSGLPTGTKLADIERDIIMKTLETQKGNRTITAEILGISVRTLRNKLALYGEMDAFKNL